MSENEQCDCDKRMERMTVFVLVICNALLAATLIVSLRTRPHDVLNGVRDAQKSIENKIDELKR